MKSNKLTANEVSKKAMKIAFDYYSSGRARVQNVSTDRKHKGYDLLVPRRGKALRVEVKGCSKEWQIPDFFHTEFNEQRQLVADILCVVYLIGKKTTLCEIPRKAIRPEWVEETRRYRISSKMKKEDVLKKYLKPLEKKRAV